MRRELRTGFIVLIIMAVVIVAGTIGYSLIEGWGLLDSLYMTMITIFTVGFGEVHELSRAGAIFTIFLILGGVGAILYGLGSMMELVVSGQLSGVFRRRVVKRQVIVENDPEALARAEKEGFLVVAGDASTDEALETAGIKKAKGLVAAVGSDADNIYVTLSARVLNPKLLIVARAASDDTLSKLQRAGADRVVSPYGIGGRQMATLMLKPLVSDYLDVVTSGGELEFRVEELELTPTCCAIGRSIGDMAVRKNTGATILAVRRGQTGAFDTNPSPDSLLTEGDTIIAIGTPAEIVKLEELVGAPEGPGA
jgi:voltage-gated potassium channel